MGVWTTLHSKTIHNLCSSLNIISAVISMMGKSEVNIDHTGEIRNVHDIIKGKSKGKRPLGRIRHRQDRNI